MPFRAGKACFEYHFAAHGKQSPDAPSLEYLIVVGDGSRRWFFCGPSVESPEGRDAWVRRVGRMLAVVNADWVMAYTDGKSNDEDGKWHDAVAAQVVIPRLLACHASLRTATGEPCGDRPTVGLHDVSNTLRFVACLSAMSMTAATWMDSANADVPALKAVAARAGRSLEKFGQAGRQTEWLHPVTINEEIWQGVAPCTRDLAAR